MTHLNDIGRFRNLTELDVNGNLLKQEVPELQKLPFLKKLNLAGNQISDMWPLPQTLEILNISYNCLKRFNVGVLKSLSNLYTLEISNNGLESLEGIDSIIRLKRFIAKNNQIQNLAPMVSLKMLTEVDLENNPVDSSQQVRQLVLGKKDILVLNLKLAPLMVKVQNYDEFIREIASSDPEEQKQVQEFNKLLGFLNNGSFFRSKRVFVKIQQQNFQVSKRSISNFSNESTSNRTQNLITPLNNLSNSGTNPNRRNDKLANSGQMRNHSTVSQRYEAIEQLYDKLLEDEDKILLQNKKREAKQRKK